VGRRVTTPASAASAKNVKIEAPIICRAGKFLAVTSPRRRRDTSIFADLDPAPSPSRHGRYADASRAVTTVRATS
jgi:hypothetical protein